MTPVESLEEELLRLLARQVRRVPVVVFAMCAIIAAMASQRVPVIAWSAWLAVVTIVLAVRLVVLRRLPALTSIPVTRRLQIAVALSAANGIVHGSSLAFFAYLPEIERAVLSMMIVGMATGAVVTTAGHRAIFAAYLAPTMLPVAILWLISPGGVERTWIEVSVGMLVLLFAALLMAIAADSFRLLRESFAIRQQHLALNTELQTALARAEGANRAKTRFLASASHDLRQPIHTLSLLAASLYNLPLDAKSRTIAEHMNSALTALASQLDGLLDISRLDAGIVRVSLAPVDIASVLEPLREEFSLPASEKGIRLVFEEPHHAIVETDPALLSRVLQNLLSNAVKYTDQGEVRLGIVITGTKCVVQLRDTGPGIPFEEQDRVFDEFYQLNNPGRDRTKGLGLGLAIVKRLTALLGVDMQMESVPGQGTVFSLELPLGELAKVAAPDNMVPLSALRGLRVLVVDDETEVRFGMKTLLEGAGCLVSLADGTEEAVKVARLQAPDLLLTDLRLQDGDDGIATVEAIRALYPGLPAILISGDTAPDRLREAETAGLTLLHKPVLADVLWQSMQRACASRLS